MLQITIPPAEKWDKKNQEFVYTKAQTLRLEHSLVSISKWEAKWGKRFFSNEEKSPEEVLDYVRCMTITQNVDPSVYGNLSNDNISQINEYIYAPMTATTFPEEPPSNGRRENISSELIYYWMVAANIPFECEKWHINRLLTLIRIYHMKNRSPKNKPNRRQTLQRYAAINASRRARLGTKG